MGGWSRGWTEAKTEVKKPKPLGRRRTHAALRNHPKLRFPRTPKKGDPAALVDYVIEAVARYLSPPKLKGENNDFACEDISASLRTKFKDELKQKLGVC